MRVAFAYRSFSCRKISSVSSISYGASMASRSERLRKTRPKGTESILGVAVVSEVNPPGFGKSSIIAVSFFRVIVDRFVLSEANFAADHFDRFNLTLWYRLLARVVAVIPS